VTWSSDSARSPRQRDDRAQQRQSRSRCIATGPVDADRRGGPSRLVPHIEIESIGRILPFSWLEVGLRTILLVGRIRAHHVPIGAASIQKHASPRNPGHEIELDGLIEQPWLLVA
jgi:hypothetical protein